MPQFKITLEATGSAEIVVYAATEEEAETTAYREVMGIMTEYGSAGWEITSTEEL